MPSFGLAVLRTEELGPEEAEADVGRAAADALAACSSAMRRIERYLENGTTPQIARLLAETTIRITEAAVAAEELRDEAQKLKESRADADKIAAEAFERGLAAGAASRHLAPAR